MAETEHRKKGDTSLLLKCVVINVSVDVLKADLLSTNTATLLTLSQQLLLEIILSPMPVHLSLPSSRSPLSSDEI